MRKIKKVLALLLAAVLLCGAFAAPAGALATGNGDYTVQETATHRFYQLVDKLIFLLGKVLNVLIPGADWAGRTPEKNSYKTEYFYPGSADFSAGDGNTWSMGFAERSFLTDIDVFDGSYYMAGTLEAFEGRVPAAVLDDQGVNAFALSDGDTTVVYAAVDGYGLARGDVLEIRRRLADFAAANGIASVNVSALHQHSCIDTLGLGAPLVRAILKNPAAELFSPDSIVKGRNDRFMEALYSAVADAVRQAVGNMVPGTLYYGSVDASEYMKDKRDPVAFDGELHRLRFVPDGGGNEIWVCEAGIHPVSLGAGTDQISGDFPYYLEQYVRSSAGADVVFIQGAELAITSNSASLDYDASAGENARAKALGEALGARLMRLTEEEALPPVLNAVHRELIMDVDNGILTLAGREGLLGSVFVRSGLTGYAAVTEIGYLEFGNARLGALLVPGEIEPAILWGGAAGADMSWNGQSWDYAPLSELCGAERLICFGLCNDQIGYILCDNDVRSMLTENEEINAASTRAGSTLAEAYGALFAAIRR